MVTLRYLTSILEVSLTCCEEATYCNNWDIRARLSSSHWTQCRVGAAPRRRPLAGVALPTHPGEPRRKPVTSTFPSVVSWWSGLGHCHGRLPACGWKHSTYQKNGRKLVGPFWIQWTCLHSQLTAGKAQLHKERFLQERVKQASAKTN